MQRTLAPYEEPEGIWKAAGVPRKQCMSSASSRPLESTSQA